MFSSGQGARGLSVLDLHYVLPGIASGTGGNIRSWTERDLEEGALGGLVHSAVDFIVLIYLSLWLCCPLLLTISISLNSIFLYAFCRFGFSTPVLDFPSVSLF